MKNGRWIFNRAAGTETAAPFSTAASFASRTRLVQAVRHVIECRVQLVADALHRANRRNGNQGRNQWADGRSLLETTAIR